MTVDMVASMRIVANNAHTFTSSDLPSKLYLSIDNGATRIDQTANLKSVATVTDADAGVAAD